MAIFGDNKKKEKKAKTAVVRHTRVKASEGGAAHDIIRAPWFSEKAFLMTENNVYVFEVPQRATKAHVAGAIKEIYNVSPRDVRVVNLPAKKKPMRTKRGQGTRAARRKAYVTLNAGDTIKFA